MATLAYPNGNTDVTSHAMFLSKDVKVPIPQSKTAWKGEQIDNSNTYTVELIQDDIEEIERALEYFNSKDFQRAISSHVLANSRPDRYYDLEVVDRSTFPLKQVASKIDQGTDSLFDGKGFFIIRGLETNKYNARNNTIIYLGLSSYVADERGTQRSNGDVLSKTAGHNMGARELTTASTCCQSKRVESAGEQETRHPFKPGPGM